jgi:hypothetical protein
MRADMIVSQRLLGARHINRFTDSSTENAAL